MDGVTVVNTIQGVCGYGDGITLAFVFLALLTLVLIVFAFLALYCMIAGKDSECFFLFIILITLSSITIKGTLNQYHAKPIYGPYQVVLVDDNVNFNEFMNRYVIVAHEGELYTIREK